ncbi:rap1 GTPase-activating protein 1 isoform X7, partial [Biomphalaria glabrata]
MRPKLDQLNIYNISCRTPTLKRMFICSAGKLELDVDESFESDSEDSCHFSPMSTSPAPVVNEDQRQNIQQILQAGPPYPMIVLPPRGGYWMEGSEGFFTSEEDNVHESISSLHPSASELSIDTDFTAQCYRCEFYGK